MVQWINVFWNNSFINLTQLSLLCEKTGSLAIVEPCLMAGRYADQFVGNYKLRKFKFCIFDF